MISLHELFLLPNYHQQHFCLYVLTLKLAAEFGVAFTADTFDGEGSGESVRIVGRGEAADSS